MINIIGLGYIGLPTTLIFACKGIEVVGTDYNSSLVNKLNGGQLTFEENGLLELYKSALDKGVRFSDKYQKADMYLIAVPTPYDKFSKKIDASYVVNATKSTLEICEKNSIIIIESTVSPGTIDKFVRPLIDDHFIKTGVIVHLVHAPERIIPGNMVYELAHNSRTIGADNPDIGERVASIYRKVTDGEVIVTDIKTAEMTKVVENTFRAVNIAFANELAKICRHDNMDVYEIIKICNMHPRVKILTPGTVMDERLVDKEKNNYIFGVLASKRVEELLTFHVAYVDISTGEINENSIDIDNFADFFLKIRPSENSTSIQ